MNKEIVELNDTIDLMGLVDTYIVFHPAATQYTFFSAAHETFSKVDHIIGHKASLSKYKNTEIIPCMLLDHNTIKLVPKNKRSSRKYSTNWRLNNTLLNDQMCHVYSF
jgi:hypothetical protein